MSDDPTNQQPQLPSHPNQHSAQRSHRECADPVRRPAQVKITGAILVVLAVLAAAAFLYGRYYFHKAMVDNLPQLDGSLTVYGLAAPVTVARDAQGVPHIRANSMEDLVFAQGFVTAQDRLWQMDLLRRHAAGELAAILGPNALEHDRLQRTLQMRMAADRAWTALPPTRSTGSKRMPAE